MPIVQIFLIASSAMKLLAMAFMLLSVVMFFRAFINLIKLNRMMPQDYTFRSFNGFWGVWGFMFFCDESKQQPYREYRKKVLRSLWMILLFYLLGFSLITVVTLMEKN